MELKCYKIVEWLVFVIVLAIFIAIIASVLWMVSGIYPHTTNNKSDQMLIDLPNNSVQPVCNGSQTQSKTANNGFSDITMETTVKAHRSFVAATGNANRSNTSKKEKLLSYFKSISGSKTITGLLLLTQYYNRYYDNDWINTIEDDMGVYPGIITITAPNHSHSASAWLHFIDTIITHWKKGNLIHIEWWFDDWPPALKHIYKVTDEVESGRGALRWKYLTEEGGILNKEWKQNLDHVVPYLQQLESEGVVVICSFFPALNDAMSPWGARPGRNGSLKLYQITRDYLTMHHGINSILWAWNIKVVRDWTTLEEYWPGDNYVDVVSVYMDLEKQLTTCNYQKLLNIVGDKPISMERLQFLPSNELLAAQPKWTWFTARYLTYIPNTSIILVNKEIINATFHSPSVINRGDIDFFETL